MEILRADDKMVNITIDNYIGKIGEE